jgi:hypothetical protein
LQLGVFLCAASINDGKWDFQVCCAALHSGWKANTSLG